jgi:hypothetical protein
MLVASWSHVVAVAGVAFFTKKAPWRLLNQEKLQCDFSAVTSRLAAAPSYLLYVRVWVADVGQHCADQLSVQPHQRTTGLLHKLLQAGINSSRYNISELHIPAIDKHCSVTIAFLHSNTRLAADVCHPRACRGSAAMDRHLLQNMRTLIHLMAVMRVNSSWLEAFSTRMDASATQSTVGVACRAWCASQTHAVTYSRQQ